MAELSVDNRFTSINPASVNQPVVEQQEDELDQGDFIELLVAQVKNQDPTKPMDPSEFMNQLTQSSMVNGLNDLQTSFDALATKLSSDQSLQAAGLVGKSVLVAGGDTQLGLGSTVTGQIDIQKQASEVTINVFNSRGEQVRTLPIGGQSAGSIQFKWDGFADDGSVSPPGDYLVTAEALIDGTPQAVEVSLEKRIDSISINNGSEGTVPGTLLNLASGQQVTLDEITQIK